MLDSTILAERNHDLLTEVEAAPDVRRKSAQPCETCGQPFEPARADAKYCSDACRQRACREVAAGTRVPEEISKPTELYRHFAADGSLLYVGISHSTARRLQQHRIFAPWFKKIARIDVQHFETREAARAAEKQAIVTERPLHNVADKPVPPAEDSDDFDSDLTIKPQRDDQDFSWADARAEGNIVQEQARETAVYVNPFGQVVIRQACWPDDDQWVVIAPANLWQLIDELQKLERQLDGPSVP
jgi:hypothetical protein